MGTSGGLRVIWDPSIDRDGWPGPLSRRAAMVGEAWLGPSGLLARLETEIGLGGVRIPALKRAAQLVSSLASRNGWWRASYEADPLGTAQRLLRDRDLLALWGWRGEPASERLAELWAATSGTSAGIPDRIATVTSAIAARPTSPPDVESIELGVPLSSVEPLWRLLFDQLAKVGVAIREAPTAPATATGDLTSARGTTFTPAGDGSLTLLRPHGPLAAAEEVAAALAALPSLDGVLIIGGDDVLDAALVRHGLPRIGAGGRSSASAALLRLVIEAAFEPMDPADLHGLLCLAPGPIPRRVAARLVDALGRFPSRRAPTWDAALAEGLARCDDSWRDEVAKRVATLVMPAVGRNEPLPKAELLRRLAALGAWAGASMLKTPSLIVLAGLAAAARELVELEPAPALSLVQLRRLCDELEFDGGAGQPSQAGLSAIAEPGAMLGPARLVVWWGFTRDAAPSAPRLRLAIAERDELRRLGVTPPDLGAMMVGTAARWRRPLDQTTGALVLVCPATTDSGEPVFPHPLWDELRAAMETSSLGARLEARTLERVAIAARRTPPLRALPTLATKIATGVPLTLRERESPSSLSKLLGCSASWALHYKGKLRSGMSAGPAAPSPLLYGTLAHHVLERVFNDGALDGEAAAAAAKVLVDGELGRLSETLALPRYQVELTIVRQVITRSAQALGVLLKATGASVHGVELPLEGVIDGIALGGNADFVIADPRVVLDLKWGRTSYRDRLAAGAALQLAVYAELLGDSPQVGYFTLGSQDLFTLPGTALPGATVVGSASPRDTWKGAVAVLEERLDELARGALRAPGADGSEHVSQLAGGRLNLAPECSYCGFGGLCGKEPCA